MDALTNLERPRQSTTFYTTLDCRGKHLDLTQPHVMGILNVTPDSFSDGGHYSAFDAALFRAERIISEGASIIDVGGESTKPGAVPVSVQEELDRIIPIIEALRDCPIPISVDTTKAEVMEAAVAAGASIINDVNALQEKAALQFVARTNVPVCLMHRQGTPQTMQHNPRYRNVVTEVFDFLQTRVEACLSAGIERQRLILDPGFGFGKTLEHNLSLLRSLKNLTALGFPVLVGVSKKNMLGELLGKSLPNRLAGSLALAAWSAMQGVKILRAHDVDATRDALNIILALQSNPKS